MLGAVREWVAHWRKRIGRKRSRALTLTEEGFSILEEGCDVPVTSIVWRNVRTIRAFKRDLFTVDMICLAFETVDGSLIEIDEETDGFKTVRDRMEAEFPEIPETWFMDIAFPAFETNMTMLYSRTSSAEAR